MARRSEPGAVTVMGLRCARAIARCSWPIPAGELRQRAKEGLELCRWRRRPRWTSTRGVAPVAGDQAAAAGHRPRARSARRRDGGARAVDEHAAREAAAGRRAARRFPSAAAMRCRAGSIARSIASSARRKRSGRCWSRTASRSRARGDRARRHRSRSRRRRRRPRSCTRSSGCPTTRRSSATSRRWCRTRGSAT